MFVLSLSYLNYILVLDFSNELLLHPLILSTVFCAVPMNPQTHEVTCIYVYVMASPVLCDFVTSTGQAFGSNWYFPVCRKEMEGNTAISVTMYPRNGGQYCDHCHNVSKKDGGQYCDFCHNASKRDEGTSMISVTMHPRDGSQYCDPCDNASKRDRGQYCDFSMCPC